MFSVIASVLLLHARPYAQEVARGEWEDEDGDQLSVLDAWAAGPGSESCDFGLLDKLGKDLKLVHFSAQLESVSVTDAPTPHSVSLTSCSHFLCDTLGVYWFR